MNNMHHQQNADQGDMTIPKAVPPFSLDVAASQIVSLAKRVSENVGMFAKATENFIIAVNALGEPADPLDGIECDATDRDVVVAHLEMLLGVIKSGKFPHTLGKIGVTREPGKLLELHVILTKPGVSNES